MLSVNPLFPLEHDNSPIRIKHFRLGLLSNALTFYNVLILYNALFPSLLLSLKKY